MKKINVVIALSLMLMFMLPLAGNAGMNTVGIELASSRGTVGFELSVKGTGLTSGSNYIVVAEHSDGNISAVGTAVGSVAYFVLEFTTADSDGIVPVHLADATAAGVYTGGDDATALYTLDTASIPGQNFFTGIIGSLLVIGIVVGLASIFVIKKRGR